MDNFFTFLKILFLSKTVLLTINPVTFIGEYELSPKEPLVAITSGASIQIDISNFAPNISIEDAGIVESRELLKNLIPEGSVKAILYSEESTVVLDNSEFALLNDGAMLILSSNKGIPVDVEFKKVKIVSDVKLKDVNIYWKNFKN